MERGSVVIVVTVSAHLIRGSVLHSAANSAGNEWEAVPLYKY